MNTPLSEIAVKAMDKKMEALDALLAAAAKVQANHAFIAALPDGEAENCADNHGETTFAWEMELAEAADAYAEAAWDCLDACSGSPQPVPGTVVQLVPRGH
jgi:hypothetical protein